MANPIRRLHLSRRTLLRGAGASIALPWLDANVPALRPLPRPPLRAAFVYMPNGAEMEEWRPSSTGASFGLPRTLESLEPVRKHLLVLTGLTLDGARSHGDGPGDHARAAGSFLTCSHPVKKGEIRAGISIDQVLANEIAGDTAFRSLELGMERGRLAGNCDSGYSCAYSQAIAWKSPTEPIAKEADPEEVFRRLFGEPDFAQRRAADERKRRTRSVLDAVESDRRKLLRELGKGPDRERVEEYFASIRDVERRLGADAQDEERFRVPDDVQERLGKSGYADRVDMMYDLIVLALQADRTRVATFMLANAGTNRSYRFLGIPKGHHYVSHHGTRADKVDSYRKINRFHVERFARFVERLAAAEVEGGGRLTDVSTVVFGSGIADGNRHNHHDLPILVAGRAGGALRTGRHLRYPKDTPLGEFYTWLRQAYGAGKDAFGDAERPLRDL